MVLNNNPVQGPVRGLDQVKELGLQNLAPNLPDIGGMFKVTWSGIGLEPLSQIDYANPGYRNHGEEFQEHLSWFRGRHNLKFGFNFTRAEIDEYYAPSALFGSASFSSRYTSNGLAGQGHPYADFLLGIPSGTSRAFAPVRTDRNRWQTDFFAQDDFKVNSRLTLNFGVRYELHLPWRENSNRVSIFDLGTGSIVVPDGALSLVSPIFPKGYVPIIEAKAAGFRSRSLIAADRNNIVPRLGASYRPWGPNTVFHAGFGVYPDVAPRVPNMGGSPFIINEPEYTNPDKGYLVLPTVFPAAGTGGPATIGLPAAINPDLKMPYSMQYSFSIDHQMWDTGFTARYMGTTTRQGEWSYNYNSPVPDSRPYIDKPRPFPQYPGHQLLHQRRRPPVQRLHHEGEPPHVEGPVLPVALDLGPRYLRPELRRRARKPLRPPPRVRRGALHPHAPLGHQQLLPAPHRQRPALPEEHAALGQPVRGRLGVQPHLHRADRPVPYADLQRPGHRRYREHHQPDRTERHSPSRYPAQPESAERRCSSRRSLLVACFDLKFAKGRAGGEYRAVVVCTPSAS